MSTMKTSAQEECGVWLDTLQLKGKAKQKRPARPISKLLNPFAEGGGYSLAVALNFTQTQMKMPKTKQSTISAFFTSHHRVLKKVSTQSCSSTSTAPAVISSGTKRRHESDREQSGVYKSEHSLDHNQFSKNVLESEPSVWQEYEVETATPSQDLYFESKEDEYEEFNPPQSKKRFTDCSLLAGNSQPPPQAWSQDPLFTCSQYTDTDRFLTSQKTTPPKVLNNHEPSVLHSVQSEETFGFNMDLEGKTSTQKSFKHLNSSQMDDVKENRTAPSPNSSSKHSFFYHVDPVSNHKWIQPTTASRRKCKQNHKEKTKRFFLKKPALVQQNGDVDEDSLAMLFTQDSEGFRVIAHRGLQTRSPLKNQTNVVTGRVKKAAYKSLGEEDEEDEMLFTQDSQGNMVIKH